MPQVSTYRCLSHDFSVTADRGEDHDLVARALAPFAARVDPVVATRYELRSRAPGEHWLLIDGARTRLSADPGEPIDVLLWDVGERAVASERRRVVLHAGAVTTPGGRALLLPGRSGSGKSTTTTGLVAAGFGYLSDEYAVLDPATGLLTGFPRPLVLKRGTRALLPHLEQRTGRHDLGPHANLHVTAEQLGGSTWQGSAPPGWVVFPAYEPGAATELVALSPGETCAELVRSTFRVAERPREVLQVLAQVARTAPGFRLTIGGLDEAVETLQVLTREPPGG